MSLTCVVSQQHAERGLFFGACRRRTRRDRTDPKDLSERCLTRRIVRHLQKTAGALGVRRRGIFPRMFGEKGSAAPIGWLNAAAPQKQRDMLTTEAVHQPVRSWLKLSRPSNCPQHTCPPRSMHACACMHIRGRTCRSRRSYSSRGCGRTVRRIPLGHRTTGGRHHAAIRWSAPPAPTKPSSLRSRKTMIWRLNADAHEMSD